MRTVALLLITALSLASLQAATRRHIAGRGTGLSDPPFGVVVAGDLNAAQVTTGLRLAHTAGVGWTEIQFTWSKLQSSPGTANFVPFDQLVTAANDSNLHIIGRLGFSTSWNTTAPATVTDAARREKYPPTSYDLWGQYVFTIVQKYKASVHHWEVWYSPDTGGTPAPGQECTGWWCGSPAQYARLLAVAFKNVKAADPTAVVLFGGLALSGNQLDQNFMSEVLSDADFPGVDSFDIAAFHAFGSKAEVLRRMNLIKSQLAFGGAGLRQIWVTEFGYSSDPAAQNVAPYFGGEDGQASYVKELAPYLLGFGARKIFWFKLIDTQTSQAAGDPFATYGLVTFTGTQKKAMTAYGDAIKAYRP
jgi:hypothetical protein